ncbi:MAG: hypothetical protein LBU60_01995 [Clostridiales bacterium]|jgi:predicted nucleotide-binding protein (sugar kinase/HSP70/actin superfamily)|nr:hypothetical protein [Clostridiales bacterium]
MFFKTTQKKICEDFAFLSNYGYYFSNVQKYSNDETFIFIKGDSKIFIEFSYLDKKFYISFKNNIMQQDLLSNVFLNGKTYNAQINQVKEILKFYLDKIIVNLES